MQVKGFFLKNVETGYKFLTLGERKARKTNHPLKGTSRKASKGQKTG